MYHIHYLARSWLKNKQFSLFFKKNEFTTLEWFHFYRDLPSEYTDYLLEASEVCPPEKLFEEHGSYFGLALLNHGIKNIRDVPEHHMILPFLWWAVNHKKTHEMTHSQWFAAFERLLDYRFHNDLFSILNHIPDILKQFCEQKHTFSTEQLNILKYIAHNKHRSDVYLPDFVESFFEEFDDMKLDYYFTNPQKIAETMRQEFLRNGYPLFKDREAERIFDGKIPEHGIFDQRLHHFMAFAFDEQRHNPATEGLVNSIYHMDELWTLPLEQTSMWANRMSYIQDTHEFNNRYHSFLSKVYTSCLNEPLTTINFLDFICDSWVKVGILSLTELDLMTMHNELHNMLEQFDAIVQTWPITPQFSLISLFSHITASQMLGIKLPESLENLVLSTPNQDEASLYL